ncbi:MAG: 2-amino-4-hydroxy-6-hydroxymethyldihydropteridine diphosphokinase [Muribaculaceae bacterium]|nr:2-amino-4-hydroxy-6-hydroxymethyldihydropteridine diphosphokinase [Muribaculaceae bacterium]
MNRAVISLGSNINGKESIISRALDTLGVKIAEATPPYMDPDDNDNTRPYLNIVAVIETDMDYETARTHFKQIEKEAGRTPSDKATGLIPLDIDIVIFNDRIIKPEDFERPYFIHGYRLLRNTRP